MPAPSITNYLQTESGRFGPEIYYRKFARSLFHEMIKKGEWMDEYGDTVHNITYERSAPNVAVPAWYAWQLVDGVEGGNCITPPEKVSFGSTDRSFSLQRRTLIGDDFCVENLRLAVMAEKQVLGVMKALGGRVKLEWMIKDRYDYDALALNKAVLIAAAYIIDQTGLTTFNSGALDDNPPDMLLNQGFLDMVREDLLRDGADDAQGMVDGVPILTLDISAEASDALLRQDSATRDDFHWGNPSQLLKAFGVEKQYKGFFHAINPYPRRFSYAAGAYTEVPVWIDSAASKGTKSSINPAWKSVTTAPYELTRVFSPDVFTRLFPRPISSLGSGFQFNPVAYNGDWRMLNILNKETNPTGTMLTPFGVLACAAEPVSPERGWVIMHKRCNPPVNAVTACT